MKNQNDLIKKNSFFQSKLTGKFGDAAHCAPSAPKMPACVIPWLVKFVIY